MSLDELVELRRLRREIEGYQRASLDLKEQIKELGDAQEQCFGVMRTTVERQAREILDMKQYIKELEKEQEELSQQREELLSHLQSKDEELEVMSAVATRLRLQMEDFRQRQQEV